ncbi:MAG: hypothetical protein HRK26_00840 [Rickettsiaceae bacterium H1]|nr:hypothetical protein [Rickettsiaceae bacterium H1]
MEGSGYSFAGAAASYVGTGFAGKFFADESVKKILSNLKEMENLLAMFKALGQGLGKEQLDEVLTQANDALSSWKPTVETLLTNLQQINQSEIGGILVEFTKEQAKLIELKQIKAKAQKTLGEAEKLTKKSDILKEIIDSLKKKLQEKLESYGEEIHEQSVEEEREQTKDHKSSSDSTSFYTTTTSQQTINSFVSTRINSEQGSASSHNMIPGNQSENSQDQTMEGSDTTTVKQSLLDQGDTDQDPPEENRTFDRGKREISSSPTTQYDLGQSSQENYKQAEAKLILKKLKQDLLILKNHTIKELESYFTNAIKQLTEYEAKHSKFAELVKNLQNAVAQGNTTLRTIQNTASNTTKDITGIKEDLKKTTEKLRKSITSVTQEITRAVSDFTGNNNLLTASINHLEGFITCIERNITERNLTSLGITRINNDNELNRWFDNFLENNGYKKTDEIKIFSCNKPEDLKHCIRVITSTLEERKNQLARCYTSQEIKDGIESHFNSCIEALNINTEGVNEDDTEVVTLLEKVKTAHSHLVRLKEEKFDQLQKTITGLGNMAEQAQQTCNNLNIAAQAGKQAADRFLPSNNITYFVLLGTGYLTSIIAATVLYYQSPKIFNNISLSNPHIAISSALFAFSIIFLLFANRSRAQIVENQNRNDIIKIFLSAIPLATTIIAFGIFLSRFIPNFITPPKVLVFHGWPLESIMVYGAVAIFLLIISVTGVKLVIDKFKAGIKGGDNNIPNLKLDADITSVATTGILVE